MTQPSIPFRLNSFLIPSLGAALFLLTACIGGPSRNTGPAVDQPGTSDRDYNRLVFENRKLKKALKEREATSNRFESTLNSRETEKQDLVDQIAKLNLALVEKGAQVEDVVKQQTTMQKKLDDAIQEVVRAKARMRSLESKAEAASNMAETEIALETLKAQHPDKLSGPEFAQVQQLLKMSTTEFQKENYGGALYLANRAKGRIRNVQGEMSAERGTVLVQGEVLFALPLPLRVLRRSNLREGPGLDFKVLATLEPDTLLVGYSQKNRWVRVTGENALKGWIFQTLVGGR